MHFLNTQQEFSTLVLFIMPWCACAQRAYGSLCVCMSVSLLQLYLSAGGNQVCLSSMSSMYVCQSAPAISFCWWKSSASIWLEKNMYSCFENSALLSSYDFESPCQCLDHLPTSTT